MTLSLTKAQVDRLGERLKKGNPSDEDVQTLDAYRRTFADAHQHVMSVLHDDLRLEPAGRSAKTTKSIVDKLQRESARLSQIQDIAGCRVVVPGIQEQDHLVSRIGATLQGEHVFDRRVKPSHGYRAVHVVVTVAGRAVEIQVRTVLQHLWAELSEKLSDVLGISVKYGGGPSYVRPLLHRASQTVAEIEGAEREGAADATLDRRKREVLDSFEELIKLLPEIWRVTR